MTWFDATLRWYALLMALSVAWAPLVMLLCRRLPDQGVTILRPLALLGTVYPAWLLAQTVRTPYTTPILVATVGVAAVVGWVVVLRRRLATRKWFTALAVTEILALASFAGYIWLRGFTPAIMNTEKAMEAAFLLSSRLATTMPPPDPWFAGEPINYYYLGYLIQGTVARLAAVSGTTAFNLALATTFSAAVIAAAGIGWNLARHWFDRRSAIAASALSTLFVMFVGNLYAAGQFLTAPEATLDAGWWDVGAGVGWRASRIVCDGDRVGNDCLMPSLTINEFPSFSFILGDLHPHVLALPFALAALSIAFALSLLGEQGQPRRLARGDWIRVIVFGAILGSLYALNSWDFPTYLAIAGLGLLWATGRWWPPAMVLVLASVAAWLPFILTYVPPASPAANLVPAVLRSIPILPRLFSVVGIHTGEHTGVGEFLTIFGVPYSIAVALLADTMRRRQDWWRADRQFLIAGAILTTLAAIILSVPLLIVCGWPLLVAMTLLRSGPTSPRAIAIGLIAAGLTLLIGTEFFYILDIFNSRMNTLFKVYYQVWSMLGVASALGIVVLWRSATVHLSARVVFSLGVSAGLVAGLVSPVLSSRAWTNGYSAWVGLDGIGYVATFSPDELAALRWLQANVRPDDVILEAAGCSYQVNGGVPFGRAAAFSGAPTVIGWDNHERQWRAGQAELTAQIPVREADVAAMFVDPANPLLDQYGVTLLYLGRYEREDWQRQCRFAGPYRGIEAAGYPGPGWTPVFGEGEVAIYRRQVSGQ